MKKTLMIFAVLLALPITATAKTHRVIKGDSMWKIAVK